MAKDMQPVFILPEGYNRLVGKDAQRTNIMAARLVAETVRTTLGPKGMDKMIVDSLGDITVTNDGVTILQEMQIEHPAAKMIVEVAKTQEEEVGDGTTSAVILAGELLKNAEKLLEQEVHPTIITKGYRLAAEESMKVLNAIAQKGNSDEVLRRVATTAMTGKGAERSKEHLADLAVRAVRQVADEEGIDIGNIKLEKKIGGGVEDTEIIQGIVIDKERVHSGMPKAVQNARIALLDCAVEIKNTETEAKIQITSPDQISAFLEQEQKILRAMADKILAAGANVVICQKGIDDLAQHYLSKHGVYACRRVAKNDMEKIARASGARIVTSLSDLGKEDLGYAGLVKEVKVGDEQMTYITECKNPKAVTLLVRGGTQHVVAEVERALKDAIGDASVVLRSNLAVGGAGAPEIEVARHLRAFATKLSGREQLAVLSFADAIEVIPRTLAENAGLDPIDVLTELKAAHDKGQKFAGIDVFSGKVMDAWQAGVVEPLKIKTQAIKSASEVTELILRIDDVIAGASSKGSSPQMPQGMPPGGMDY